jgi:AsmA-like C-terminal region
VRERIRNGLNTEFAGQADMRTLRVTLFPRIRVEGEDFALRRTGATNLPPLISIKKFSAEANIAGVLRRPPHVSQVRIEGLQIAIPPRSERQPLDQKSSGKSTQAFVLDQIIADGTVLTMIPADASKEPLAWDIRRLTLFGAGPKDALSFRATLTNARPPGDIESTGKFGPWVTEEPGDTPVSGEYTFQNADLSVFKGIAGRLSSQGKYNGTLDSIEVNGQTDTPDFAVTLSGNPVHLTTQFHAVVDGTDGDTQLQPVTFQFGGSSLTAQGSVEGIKGVKGKTVSLDVTTTNARLEDMLLLGVKGKKPAMRGAIGFKTKLVIPSDHADIPQTLKLDGSFTVDSAHFTQLNIQEKVNKLSHSGKGEPEESDEDTVASDFAGRFALDNGVMALRNLSFRVPGIGVFLNGTYGIATQQLDFHGTARLEVPLSQATTGVKSFFLKLVDPFFKKKNAGAVIPIKISGNREKPAFGLDL